MYKIIIVKEERFDTTEEEYQRVADTGNERDDGPVYEYVEHKTTKTRTIDLLEQRVENLDIEKVIKAVNGIE